jgi:hypothetical protein
MDAEKPRRRWSRRKRWLAAGLLLLAQPIAYFTALGPLEYLGNRNLLPRPVLRVLPTIYAPYRVACRTCPPFRRSIADPYFRWWVGLAARHENGPE